MPIAIYGAKSLALGMYRAIEKLYPDEECIGFVVNSLKGNPHKLANLRVIEMDRLKEEIELKDRDDLHILVCTPEDLHDEIAEYLEENGFNNYTCMDSVKEAKLMEGFFVIENNFKSLHRLPLQIENQGKKDMPKVNVYQAKFYKDKVLNNTYDFPDWMYPIQVGAALTDVRVAEVCDNQGENISAKNVNYCELTALYWMWKNKLVVEDNMSKDYYGLFHYRRILDISEEDIKKLRQHDVDIVVSYPTFHEPDIKEHHSRYIKESDWEAMLTALEELQPEYRVAYDDIFSQEFMYNYNIMVAKKEILLDYCNWLFPILERTEELSVPKGSERADRYIGYLGENLMTLYFMYNADKLKIYHTGRVMLL